MTDETNHPAEKKAGSDEGLKKVSRLFDVRRVIGGLFVIYGVIIGLVGLLDDQSDIDKAQGVRINLWMGLGMLALGLGMLLWLKLNPTPPPRTEAMDRPDADD